MAVAEASFKIEMLSISWGFIKFKGFLEAFSPPVISPPPGVVDSDDNGTPSTTNSGLLLERMEFAPLILMFTPAPGSPLD
jgi:hypothetical protein